MKIKKVLAFAAAVMLAAGTMSGCGSGEKNKSDNVELTWYYVGGAESEGNDEVFAKANEIIKEKLGFTVNFRPIDPSSYEEKIKMVISGGEDYDICWASNWRNDYSQNVANGSFLELDELLNETPELKASVSDKIWDGMRIGGKIYGVPCQQIMARSTGLAVPQIYSELYDKEITGKVTKYRDLTPYIKAVSKDHPNEAIVKIGWQDMITLYDYEALLGTKIPGAISLKDDGPINVFNQFDTDEFKDAVRTRNEWNKAGYTLKGKSVSAKSEYNEWERPMDISSYAPGAEVGNGVAGFKTVSKRISEPYLTTSGITSTLQAINVNSKHPVEALKLLELVDTNSELINLLSYGIEGKNYEKLEGNYVRRIQKSGYFVDAWRIGNVFNGYLGENQPDDLWEKTKEYNDNAKTSRVLGFSPTLDDIKLEVNNCKSVVEEYMDSFDEGLGDADAQLKEMNDRLEQAGLRNVLDEIQRQIDEWLEKK